MVTTHRARPIGERPLLVGDEDGEDIIIRDEDVERIRVAPSPKMPTAEEVEEHIIAHYPFRDWCRECIEGRALGERRGQADHGPGGKLIPTVGIDYFFITKTGLRKRQEITDDYPEDAEGDAKLQEARAKGEIVKCVMVRDSETKAMFAHVVPCKGIDEDRHVVDLVRTDIEWMGHVRLLLKSDNEPAVKRLLEQTLVALKLRVESLEHISKEFPGRYESQSNGMVESAAKIDASRRLNWVRHIDAEERTV